MEKIQTTLGELESRELGRVDVHEHIIIEGETIMDESYWKGGCQE